MVSWQSIHLEARAHGCQRGTPQKMCLPPQSMDDNKHISPNACWSCSCSNSTMSAKLCGQMKDLESIHTVNLVQNFIRCQANLELVCIMQLIAIHHALIRHSIQALIFIQINSTREDLHKQGVNQCASIATMVIKNSCLAQTFLQQLL